ncbi:GL16406 [Drosophila persimilis]|uniref:GL16406 n=1 Tax=Drosophila persimilis TaxID=7234 RepID=B4GQP6_DROPE|nr:GL16406 [Drosophila persimilis]
MLLLTSCALLITLAGGIHPSTDRPCDTYDLFSPRILVTSDSTHPISTAELPITLVRRWLRELGLIQLRSQVVQAKHMRSKEGTILFELRTALQALQVVDTWNSPSAQDRGVLKGLKANQTKIDFFNDFPKAGEFDTEGSTIC